MKCSITLINKWISSFFLNFGSVRQYLIAIMLIITQISEFSYSKQHIRRYQFQLKFIKLRYIVSDWFLLVITEIDQMRNVLKISNSEIWNTTKNIKRILKMSNWVSDCLRKVYSSWKNIMIITLFSSHTVSPTSKMERNVE